MIDVSQQEQNIVLDAVGPETFTFEELVRLIAAQIGKPVRTVRVPVFFAYLSTRLTGLMMRDVVLTWEEYKGLMSNLLAPTGRSTGKTRLSRWLLENREHLGRYHASEVARHFAVPA